MSDSKLEDLTTRLWIGEYGVRYDSARATEIVGSVRSYRSALSKTRGRPRKAITEGRMRAAPARIRGPGLRVELTEPVTCFSRGARAGQCVRGAARPGSSGPGSRVRHVTRLELERRCVGWSLARRGGDVGASEGMSSSRWSVARAERRLT
eukprot:2663088-Rhodomonas_salina.4